MWNQELVLVIGYQYQCYKSEDNIITGHKKNSIYPFRLGRVNLLAFLLLCQTKKKTKKKKQKKKKQKTKTRTKTKTCNYPAKIHYHNYKIDKTYFTGLWFVVESYFLHFLCYVCEMKRIRERNGVGLLKILYKNVG